MGRKLGSPYRIYIRGATYWAYFSYTTISGEKIQFRCSCQTDDPRKAEQFCLEKISEIRTCEQNKLTGELPSISFDEAFARYFEEKVKNYSQPKAIFSRLIFIKNNIGIKYLHELDKKTINDFVQKRKQTVSNATINRELSILSAVRTLAENFWERKVNEAKPLKFKLPEPAENIKYLKDWNIAQKIIDQAAPHLKPIIYTALYTGMRLGNILSLKWQNVDFSNNVINIKVKDKNISGGKNLSTPMVNKLKVILSSQPKINEYVFNYRNKPISSIKHSWHNIFYDSKGNLKNPEIPYINFHTLRHTAATWILRKTNNLRITKEILGHANINTTMKYAHVLDDEKRKALNAVFD